jgi:cobalamin biosynthesis Mg chelatase CobN
MIGVYVSLPSCYRLLVMTTLTNKEVLAELYYTQKAIKLVTGVTPLYWRPAFGDVDDRVRWIATQLNLTTILWNLDTDDWAAGNSEPVSTVQQNYDDFIAMGSNGTFKQNGNIVLTHEIDNMTMSLAIKNLPQITKSYKNVMDVATCMNITYPYQEKTIKFPSFADFVSGKKDTTAGSNSTASAAGSSSGVASSKSSSASGSVAGAASGSAASGSAVSAEQSTAATSAGFKPVPSFAVAAVLTFMVALL